MSAETPAPNVYPVIPPAHSGGGGRGCLLALAVVLGAGLAISMLVNLALIGARGGPAARPGGPPAKPEPLVQKWVHGEGEAKICLIELSGVILDEVKSGGVIGVTQKPVEKVKRQLDEAAKDENVKAVVFAVDSPGGSVSASDEIWHAFRRYKERTKKPVVVWMGGLCASGGYYVSSPADLIVASPTTITGSIGVILQTFNVAGLLSKFDVQNITIKAGANKDLLNPFQPPRPEHVQIIQGMIDEAYDLFVKRVSDGRAAAGLAPERVRQLADGRIYTAEQALKEKLVDKIGYREDAYEEAKALAKVSEATVFRYSKPPSLLEALFGEAEAEAGAGGGAASRAAAGGAPALEHSLESLLSLETPRLMYLWAPGGIGR